MTFNEALEKALLEEYLCVRRKGWASGVALVIDKNQLYFQHIAACSLTGPKPFEYLKDDWYAANVGDI